MSRVQAVRDWFTKWPVLLTIIAVLGLSVYSCRAAYYEPFRIPSAAMHPTLPEGSFILVRKLGYGYYGTYGLPPIRTKITAPVARGDIIVFELMSDPRTKYLMRIVGLPGERITYDSEHRLAIDGKHMPFVLTNRDGEYQYATETVEGREYTIAFMPERVSRDLDIEVPQGHYAVLGDSRDNARDSRYIGTVPRQNIVGVVEFR